MKLIFNMRRAVYTLACFLSSKNDKKQAPGLRKMPLLILDKKRSCRQNAAPSAIQRCRDQDLNQGHSDFQSDALPTELSRLHLKWRGNYMEG